MYLDLLAFHDADASSLYSAEMSAHPQGEKRKRPKNKYHSHLPACDTCRLRRVRCERLDPDNPACKACRGHGIKCTNARKSSGNDRRPEGRNIALARQLFGSRSEQQDEPASGIFAEAPLALSSFDAEGRLGQAEQTEAMMSSFLDIYLDGYSKSKRQTPTLLHLGVLAAKFDRAGRRLSQLDVTTETLVLACIALGAHISDHPSFVGADSPRLSDIARRRCTTDLSLFGQRRVALCNNFKDHIVALVDRRGFFKHASLESISVLGLASDLVSQIGGHHQTEVSRPYWVTQAQHTRAIRDNPSDEPDELDHRPELYLPFKDSFRSAWTGMNFMLEKDNLDHLWGRANDFTDLRRLSKEELVSAANSPDPRSFMAPTRYVWSRIVQHTRDFATRIAMPLRRDRSVSLDVFLEMLTASADLWSVAIETGEVLATVRPDVRSGAFAHQWSGTTAVVDPGVQGAPMALGNLLLITLKWWRRWKDGLFRLHEICGNDKASEDDMKRFEAALQASLSRAVSFFGELIDGTEDDTVFFTHLSPFVLVYWQFPRWVEVAASIPCAEAGGPPHFTFEKQISTIRALVRAQHVQGWCWPRAEQSAREGEKIIESLLQRQQTFAPPLPHFSAPPLPSDPPSEAFVPPSGPSSQIGADTPSCPSYSTTSFLDGTQAMPATSPSMSSKSSEDYFSLSAAAALNGHDTSNQFGVLAAEPPRSGQPQAPSTENRSLRPELHPGTSLAAVYASLGL